MRRLPHSVQPFLQACLQPVSSPRLAALLLASDFFGLPVRAAYRFQSSVQTSAQDATLGRSGVCRLSCAVHDPHSNGKKMRLNLK